MFELETHTIADDTFVFVYEASVNGNRVPGRYATKQMAIANALCWIEFHPDETTETDTFEIEDTDEVVSMARRNGVPQNQWTGAQFLGFLAGMMRIHPEMQIKVGREDSNCHKAKGRDFFVEIKTDPNPIKAPRAFIVRRK